jgi:arginyl-tRNA synthetase
VTPAHLSAAVAAAVRAAVDDGELVLPSGVGSYGETGDVVPVDSGRAGVGDADYLSAAPLRLAALAGRAPGEVAAILAARLRRVPGVAEAFASPSGHCALRLRADARGALVAAIVTGGAAYARSRALGGTEITVAKAGNLARAHTLDQARTWLAAEVTGRLTEAAGGRVRWTGPEVVDPPESSPVAGLLAAAGVGATHYALLRTTSGAGLDPAVWARAHTDNPAYAVRYAHAHAAGQLRQAADLGITLGDPGDVRGDLLATAEERALLRMAADLPRRIALAAAPPRRGAPAADLPPSAESAVGDAPGGGLRRNGAPAPANAPVVGRPEGVVRYLDGVAEAYLGWQGGVLPVGGEKRTELHVARVWLVAGVRTVLQVGLEVLGVAAPARM